jgi:hypothetical protein
MQGEQQLPEEDIFESTVIAKEDRGKDWQNAVRNSMLARGEPEEEELSELPSAVLKLGQEVRTLSY